MEIKPKTNKWNLIKLNSFYTAEETLNNVKRQNSEWEKIITNETANKQFIPRIYSQLIQHNTRKTKTNNPIKKWSKDLNGHFSKKDISSVQFSHVRLFVTPWTAAPQASVSFTISWSLLKHMSIESVIPFQPSHPRSSTSPPTFDFSQHQGLFK